MALARIYATHLRIISAHQDHNAARMYGHSIN